MPSTRNRNRIANRWIVPIVLVVVGGAENRHGTPAWGQTVGPGASPGRAAYRPATQWNNGPFYTTSHWDPYAPHAAVNTELRYQMPNEPPYNTAPRGVWSTFNPGQGTLHSYAQGFSPYSGYADWYKKANNFTPTTRDLAGATTSYFRSSPIPPSPTYLAPRVAQAYYYPPQTVPVTTTARNVTAMRTTAAARTAPMVVLPSTTPVRSTTSGPVIYRYGR